MKFSCVYYNLKTYPSIEPNISFLSSSAPDKTSGQNLFSVDYEEQ